MANILIEDFNKLIINNDKLLEFEENIKIIVNLFEVSIVVLENNKVFIIDDNEETYRELLIQNSEIYQIDQITMIKKVQKVWCDYIM